MWQSIKENVQHRLPALYLVNSMRDESETFSNSPIITYQYRDGLMDSPSPIGSNLSTLDWDYICSHSPGCRGYYLWQTVFIGLVLYRLLNCLLHKSQIPQNRLEMWLWKGRTEKANIYDSEEIKSRVWRISPRTIRLETQTASNGASVSCHAKHYDRYINSLFKKTSIKWQSTYLQDHRQNLQRK